MDLGAHITAKIDATVELEARKVARYKPTGFLLFFMTRQSFHPAIDRTRAFRADALKKNVQA